ncbi:MAG TPA: PAS domain S-box protein [Thermoanaerobaculia bacterium]|nr:PAS domain S-box protein [Thermoanaerobaculia bacterium]
MPNLAIWRERAFQTLVDNAPDIISRFDRELRHLYVNAAVTRSTGRPPSDFIGRTNEEAGMPADLVAQWGTVLRRVFDEGRETVSEFSYTAPSGNVAWFRARIVPEFGPDGSVESVISVARDISEVKAAEEARLDRARAAHIEELERANAKLRKQDDDLRESTALLCAISDTSADRIFAKDREGRMRFVNPATLALIGKSLAEVLGRTDAEFRADADVARQLMANDRAIIERGEPAEIEEIVPLPDGTERIWSSRKLPYRDDRGEVIGLLGISRDITERKNAEVELCAAHESLARILNSITDGLAVLDREWRYTYLSDAGAKMLGVRREDLLGRSIWELFPHTQQTKFGEEYVRAVETGETTHFEEFYPEPLSKWLECHCYPTATGLAVYFRDVTERKRAEESLRESEQRLRLMIDTNPIGVIRGDVHGNILDANPAFLRLIGGTREDLAANRIRWDELTPPEYAALDARAIDEARERSVSSVYEKEYRLPDGSRVPVLVACARFAKDEAVAFVVDITDRKRVEEALRRSEHRLRPLVDGNIIGVVTANRDAVVEANDAFLRIIGYTREEMERGGIDWRAITPPEHAGADDAGIELLETLGTCPPFEKEFVRRDGTRVPVLLGASTLHDEPLEWVSFVVDQSEKNALLETEKRLRAEAESATAAKDKLLAAVSHELRNPLTTMSGWLQILEGDTDAGMRALAFRSMRAALNAQKRMVDDLLDAVRFARGNVPLDIETIDLAEIVTEVASTMKPLATESGVHLHMEAAPAIAAADRVRIAQVVANLLSNALKFTDAGGSITLRTSTAESTAIIDVVDTGAGIDPEFLPRVFEKFSQGERHSRRGLGLGLSIVRDIVQQHGGRVTAESDGIGKGARFTVTLPRESASPREN